MSEETPYSPQESLRIVTAASLFDGHDAAINIMRRMLQAAGAEVIHLGHNRAVHEIVDAAVQEDAQAIAISSYQGGHMEFFKYTLDLLRERGADHIKLYGGGGGTIIPEEIRALQEYGVTRIYHPEDGRRLGLQGMINDLLKGADFSLYDTSPIAQIPTINPTDTLALARLLTLAEGVAAGRFAGVDLKALIDSRCAASKHTPIIGFTGTGGAGKSSLVDELLRRYIEDFPNQKIALLSVDPTKRKSGGALLGDRIRMNAFDSEHIFMRSLATRQLGSEISPSLPKAIEICQRVGFDLIIIETSGIGQADAAVVDLVDLPIYVMTPEFGAQTQLEKIEMLDFAKLVVVNKFDKIGAHDALRDVRKAYQRAHLRFSEPLDDMPVFATVSSAFNDRGVNTLYKALITALNNHGQKDKPKLVTAERDEGLPQRYPIIPREQVHYLNEVARCLRTYKAQVQSQAALANDLWALGRARQLLQGGDELRPKTIHEPTDALGERFNQILASISPASLEDIDSWPDIEVRYRAITNSYQVRGRTIEVESHRQSLSGQAIPKVALPRFDSWGTLLRWRGLENLPGFFPFTAGVFPFKRRGEDPTRMFAGEGGPARTNRRFHYLSRHAEAKRLSTAFDSVTLYGEDPSERPDIWGKVGNSGVSIATVEDMEQLYAGFDLVDPKTSVSMTINGPAPTILAFFFNVALRQSLRRFLKDNGRLNISSEDCLQPNGGGLSWNQLQALVSPEEQAQVEQKTWTQVRGTVQADILKEDQAQNTCIFSTEFSLKLMGDVQQWFTQHQVRNFYSVSVSGYHIAEAGANPITQLAFTLANGFTLVEYYLARGLHIDEFAPNLSFFFSNGMDPEYTVLGRVARRIWAVSMRDRYGASERGQKLKYHIQTSGRSLHAQEIAFNDIRTTLQALLAIYDNCNSLHTNAYDEAITTPTEESVRRALAIQLIINNELGLAKNENPNQGAFIIDELTELVEEAVLDEFQRLDERGGVLGAMERMYQRSKIQEESMLYEHPQAQRRAPHHRRQHL